MRLPLTIFLVLLVLGVFQNLVFVPRLSDRVATSFDGSGGAHAWQGRTAFQREHFFGLGFVTFVMGGAVVLIHVLPASMMNVPYRAYYLAPGRVENSVAFLGRHMMWMTAATAAILLAAFQLTIDANLSGTENVGGSSMWIVMGVYVAFSGGWLIWMFTKFRRPPSEAAAAPPASAAR